jgi:hypothetical protein
VGKDKEALVRNTVRAALIGSFALATVIGLSAASEARDYCIGTSQAFYVLKGFTVPRPGNCKPASGYVVTNVANTMVGNACTDSAGTHLTINLTIQYPSPAPNVPGAAGYLLTFSFPYPSLTTGHSHEYLVYPTPMDLGDSSAGYTLAPCQRPTPPAP